jgi:hypothetical protein
MNEKSSYSIDTSVKFGPLEVIDVPPLWIHVRRNGSINPFAEERLCRAARHRSGRVSLASSS